MTTEEIVIKALALFLFIVIFGGAAVAGLWGDDNA